MLLFQFTPTSSRHQRVLFTMLTLYYPCLSLAFFVEVKVGLACETSLSLAGQSMISPSLHAYCSKFTIISDTADLMLLIANYL